jgi:curli biogenesis system outer membrane secretion channel CsgG
VKTFFSLLLTFILSASCVFGALAADKPVVAVMTFATGRIDDSWSGWSLEEGITNLVTDELVNSNKVIVVERSRIEQIQAEQHLGATGAVEAETASQIGRLTGARLAVMGTITEWDLKQSAGIGISFLRVSGSQAKVSLTGRVVDTETGQILGSLSGSGSKTGAGISVDSFRGISFNAEQFQSSTLGQATTAAVKQFVDNLLEVIEKANLTLTKAEAAVTNEGTVLVVLPGDQIVINLGANHGMKLNATINIYSLMTIPGIKDPVRIPVGTAKVINVDPEASVAKIESKTQDIKQGDAVSLQ